MSEENEAIKTETDVKAQPSVGPPAQAVLPDAGQRAYKAPQNGEIKWTDRVMAFFTICLVLVAIGQWFTFHSQWKEMHSGGTDTHDLALAAKEQAAASKALADQAKTQVNQLAKSLQQADTLIKEATSQANATNILAEDSKFSLRANAENIELDQRAWVGLSRFDNGSDRSIPPGSFAGIQLDKPFSPVMENTGRTPAKDIKAVMGIYIIRGNDFEPPLKDGAWMDKLIEAKKAHKWGNMVSIVNDPTILKSKMSGLPWIYDPALFPPGFTNGDSMLAPMDVDIGVLPPNIPTPLDSPVSTSIAEGETVIIYGKITYRDIFKDTPLRQTTFCNFSRNPTRGGYVACPTYNDMN